MENETKITEFESNKLMVSRAISGSMADFEERISLEPVENGTEVTIQIQGEMGDLFKLARPILTRRVRGQVANDMETLKVLLEAAG